MDVWPAPTRSALSKHPVVLLGSASPIQRILARELRALPAPLIRAADFEDACENVDEGAAPSILLAPEGEIDVERFEEQLAELRVRSGSPRLVPIAFGRAPDDARRRALRRVGIDLALFGRFGRHCLRFQINRALSPWVGRAPRGELRAPKEWRTRTFSSGREKAVRCYSLSSGGAYLVTPRPWVVGSDIDLELPIGGERIFIGGRILYTNLGGGTEQSRLPRGMAVGFRPMPWQIRQVIREDVTATQQGLEV